MIFIKALFLFIFMSFRYEGCEVEIKINLSGVVFFLSRMEHSVGVKSIKQANQQGLDTFT